MLFTRAFGIPNLNVVAKTSNYTLTLADDVVTGSVSGGTFTLTLPSAVGITGKQYLLKRTDQTLGTMLNIATTSSQTINGVTTSTLARQYEELLVISDGANWIAKRYIPTVWSSYTPTCSWNTNVTVTGFWQPNGDSCNFKMFVACSGAPNVAFLNLSVPTGLTIDTAKLTNTATTMQGLVKFNDQGVDQFLGTVSYSSTTSFDIYTSKTQTGANPVFLDFPQAGQTVPFTFGNTDTVAIEVYNVPITNWKG